MMIEWYDNLNAARGISSAADVRRLTVEYGRGYSRLLAAFLPNDTSAPIYDAGCGPGLTLSILRSLGYVNGEGTDLSGDSVSLAAGLDLNVRQADSIEDLAATKDEHYSCILAVDFIEHLAKDDLVRFIQIARSKLVKNGVLIMRCPNGDTPLVGRHLFNDLTHVWTYTSTALKVILSMGGFSRATFLDETIPFIRGNRKLRKLSIKLSTSILRFLFKTATRENIGIFAPSFWVVARVD